MSDKTALLDKLKEHEKTGHYDGAVGDIYALIHHIAALEEEIDDLKARAPRPVGGDGSDLPDGAVVTSVNGVAYQLCSGRWWGFHAPTGQPALPVCGAPYTIIYTPKENTND